MENKIYKAENYKEENINVSKILQQALGSNVNAALQRKCEPWDKRRIEQ